MPLPDHDIAPLVQARHGDPFALLGVHADAQGRLWLRGLLPGAVAVSARDRQGRNLQGAETATLQRLHPDGVFEGQLAPGLAREQIADYRFDVLWPGGVRSLEDDPYRFGPVLGELDLWLLAEGTHLRPFEVLGARPLAMQGVEGTAFAVWAPNASAVSVVGSFNHWDGRRHPMRLRRECGVWELFVPGVGEGALYKYQLHDARGDLLPHKADPCARRSELRPATASVVSPLPPRLPRAPARQAANAPQAPISIYEVHLGSWRRKPEEGNRWLSWDELADTLVPYALDLGFTHLELLPISEHPFDGSWGYQPIGLYAPTARFGPPEGFGRFVRRCHDAGLGLLLDWVPAHFPADAHGLGRFDGTPLYEHADPREGFHRDWNTLIYNFGRTEVRNFLVGNALYWLECWGVDGLRVDAVASMLYRDYSRRPGEWVPNIHGGRENLEAISFLQRMNEVLGAERPQALTLAEESTSFAGVSRPTSGGGLGFHYKWNMGWMHDSLQYFQRDPVHRRHHHGEITFSMVYAYSEHYVLPISHDEVVHGKGSMLAKMPGDRWQQLANLRAFYGWMWAHPGKKLLFMGCEFGQVREWNHDASLDWHLLADPAHAGLQRLVRDLNRLYRGSRALHERELWPDGFEWLDPHEADRSVLAFVRRAADPADHLVVAINLTPVVHTGWRLGVPGPGRYLERLNTDSAHYGGSNVGTPLGAAQAERVPWQGRAWSIAVTLPPLAAVFYAPETAPASAPWRAPETAAEAGGGQMAGGAGGDAAPPVPPPPEARP